MRRLFAVLCVALQLVACAVQPPECDEKGNLLLKACDVQPTYYPKGNDENGEGVILTPLEGILESGARYVFSGLEFNLNDLMERENMCLAGHQVGTTAESSLTPLEAAEIGQHYVDLRERLFDFPEYAFINVSYCPEADSWMLSVVLSVAESDLGLPPLTGAPGITVIHRSDSSIYRYGWWCPVWEPLERCPSCGREMETDYEF